MKTRSTSEEGGPTSPAGPVEGVKEALRLEPAAQEGQASGEEVLARLARAGCFRDEETAEHVERMSRSCALIARGLGWDSESCIRLRAASALHDIGKVGVPDAVLQKPGKLTAHERTLVEAHTKVGHDILAGSDDPVLQLAATVALTHHERHDGGGYPGGQKGEAIPLAGRIAAVADVFDALTHDRVYRRAFSVEEATESIRQASGSQFDPQVVEAFESVLPEIREVWELYPDTVSARGGTHALFAGPERPVRALIVNAHGAIADGLELVLMREGIDVADSARSIEAAREALDAGQVDVVVVDPQIDEGPALRLIASAKRRGTAVLVYTSVQSAKLSARAIQAGADGAVATEGASAEFVAAVRAVARGDEHLDPRLVAPSAVKRSAGESSPLTPREREVVTLLATGLTGEQIAERLFLSSETVRTHVKNAMQRLGVKTRVHLTARAITSGVIKPPASEAGKEPGPT